jgi:hypothetical protein
MYIFTIYRGVFMFVRPADSITTMVKTELETAKKSQQEIEAQWLQNQHAVDLFFVKDNVVQATAAVAVANAVVVAAAIAAGFAMKGNTLCLSEVHPINLQGVFVKGMSLDSLLSIREENLI